MSLVAKERNTPRVARWRDAYLEALQTIGLACLVFVDETGTHTSMTREYARGPIGERVVGTVTRSRGSHVLTVAGAMALDGLRAMMAYEGGTSREAFLRFVRDALVPSLRKGDAVILDNLGAHRAAGVRDASEAVGARLLYLPHSQPQLNPIEPARSKLKAFLEKVEARTLQALAIAIRLARESVTHSDAKGWFHHAGCRAQGE